MRAKETAKKENYVVMCNPVPSVTLLLKIEYLLGIQQSEAEEVVLQALTEEIDRQLDAQEAAEAEQEQESSEEDGDLNDSVVEVHAEPDQPAIVEASANRTTPSINSPAHI